jgi:hypothetical protein
MDTVFVAIVQLIFVTVVYCVAYRVGYKAAHAKAVSIVQACAGPVNEMLDRLIATEAVEDDEEDET